MLETYGKFELLTCIGRGGMAEVYLARQKGEGRFERTVVVKRILPQHVEDRRFVELFLEEARIAAMLDHPNVVPIYDLGRVEDSYFIAMPYIHGLTVQTLITEARNQGLHIPVGIGCEIVCQVLDGLHYTHERANLDGAPMKLVHRDVSPSNLMVNEQGRSLLLDFGVALAADSTSEEVGSLRGKLAYMSPEQVRSQTLDRRSDIFSVGVVLYELLVGRKLFSFRDDPDNGARAGGALARQPSPDVAVARAGLPPRTAAVLGKALALDREDRFMSAARMSEALERAVEPAGPQELGRFLRDHFSALLWAQQHRVQQASAGLLGESVPTRVDRPPSARKKSPPPAKRGRLRALLLVALALCLAGAAAALFLVRSGRPSGPALRFGVTPFLPEELLRRDWRPLQRYLERRLDRPVELVVSRSYRQMMDTLLASDVDVAELSAFPYLLARRRDPGIVALAMGMTLGQPSYRGYMVVRHASPARRLSDLRESRVCYVDDTSTSGYLMPRAMVRRHGLDPDRFFASFQFSGDHYRALADLVAARCDVACVGSSSFKAAMSQAGIAPEDLRVLAVSPPLPHGVYVASSRLPEALVEKVRATLLGLDLKKELGRGQLGQHLQRTAFRKVEQRAFEELDQEVARALSAADSTRSFGADAASGAYPKGP